MADYELKASTLMIGTSICMAREVLAPLAVEFEPNRPQRPILNKIVFVIVHDCAKIPKTSTLEHGRFGRFWQSNHVDSFSKKHFRFLENGNFYGQFLSISDQMQLTLW